jgi:hypothetical protein
MESTGMLDARTRFLVAALLVVVFALVVTIVRMASGPPAPETADSQSEIQTEAVGKFIAQLTASAPLPSPTRRLSPSPTTQVPTASSGTPGCLGLRFVRDVTILDNSEMDPAEVFTKTWQVENSGTCAWKPGFQVVLIGGVAMGGSPFRVTQTVGPGGSIQVSIKMVAPTNETGIVQGTWKMADERGSPFGDFLSVVIVVKGRAPATSAPSATGTP